MDAIATHITNLSTTLGQLTGHAMNGRDADAMRELAVEGITEFAGLLGALSGAEAPAPAKRGRPRKVEVDETEDAPKAKRGRPKGSGNKTKAEKPAKAKKAAPSADGVDPDEFIAGIVAEALETGELPSFGRGRPSELKIRAKEAAEKALRKQARENKKAAKADAPSKKSGGKKASGKKKGGAKRKLPA